MPKAKLFDEESEDEVEFKTENEYAKKYDKWREKEELHKLEQKYGPNAQSDGSDSDSEDDSDGPPEVSEEVEAQFLKTLALLKTKDPRIYDPGYKFFEEKIEKEDKKPKEKTLVFDDNSSDDDDGDIFTIEKKAEIDKPEEKPSTSGTSDKSGSLQTYLSGGAAPPAGAAELEPLRALWSDPALNEGEAFLRDYILNKRYLEADGGAGSGEDRLRDDEALEADERRVEHQRQFERAFNFRYEEPDHDFLKRFPRSVGSVRPRDERRSKRRAERRERKEREKEARKQELARMRALKRREIEEKVARIAAVAGGERGVREEDLEGDFDPEEHDRRMREMFDAEYYGDQDETKPEFPDLDEELEIENWDKFDPEAERREVRGGAGGEGETHCEDEDFNMDADYDPQKSRLALLEQLKSNMATGKRRKRRSKLAQLLAKEKPVYVPDQGTSYDQYMDEYYQLDCEDVIAGEIPTRFKYREVEPNDYGLSIEEILLADDKELTQWVPLKRLLRLRPAAADQADRRNYRQRADDDRTKCRILPSLYRDLPEEPEVVVPVGETIKKKKKKKKNKEKVQENGGTIDNAKDDADNADQGTNTKQDTTSKKKKKKHKNTDNTDLAGGEDVNINNKEKKHHKEVDEDGQENESGVNERSKKKIHKAVEKTSILENDNSEVSITNKKKKKHKQDQDNSNQSNNDVDVSKSKKKKHDVAISENGFQENNELGVNKEIKKKKKKHKTDSFVVENVEAVEPSQSSADNRPQGNKNLKRKKEAGSQVPSKKKKLNKMEFKQKDKLKNKQKQATADNPLGQLSDERLKAYGLNPKKYRSFLKYKKF